MEIVYSKKGIFSLNLNGKFKKRNKNYKIYSALKNDIINYFKGEKVDFKKYKIDFQGLTEFEKKILKKTRAIPYGKTVSYSDLDKRARAVGNALGKNRVPIIIPCHRVVQKNGDIGGFSAGIKWKKRLLLMGKNKLEDKK